MNAKLLAAIHRCAATLGGSSSSGDAEQASEPLLKDLDSGKFRALVEEYGEIFLCDGCGWWCDNSEQTGNGECAECNPDD